MFIKYAFSVLVAVQSLFLTAATIESGYYWSVDQFHELDIYHPHEVEGDLTSQRPAILLVHGGAWVTGNKSSMSSQGHYFASLGYVCIACDYRLLRYAENMWPTQLDDVRNALGWMRDKNNGLRIDPNRIAALGVSAGGHVVLQLALNWPVEILPGQPYENPPACVIGIAAPANFLSYTALGDARNRRLLALFLGRDPLFDRSLAKLASPYYNVSDGGTVPVFLVHGTRDSVVSHLQAIDYASAVEDSGSVVRMLLLPGETHRISKAGRLRYMSQVAEFLHDQLGQ